MESGPANDELCVQQQELTPLDQFHALLNHESPVKGGGICHYFFIMALSGY